MNFFHTRQMTAIRHTCVHAHMCTQTHTRSNTNVPILLMCSRDVLQCLEDVEEKYKNSNFPDETTGDLFASIWIPLWGSWFSVLQFALITDVCGDKDITSCLAMVAGLFTIRPRCAVFVQIVKKSCVIWSVHLDKGELWQRFCDVLILSFSVLGEMSYRTALSLG